MDSFYDVPRRAPLPTPVERFSTVPVVPDVSMICPTKSTGKDFMPYHTWKMQQYPNDNRNILSSKKENRDKDPAFNHYVNPQTNTSQLFKKQVRFESPILQQRPSLTYEPFDAKRNVNKNPLQVCEAQIGVKDNRLPLDGKTFEEIYMSNVPTRQLDLSIIELPKLKKKPLKPMVILEERQQERQSSNLSADAYLEPKIDNKENDMPKTYREFLETQKKIVKGGRISPNDSVTDIFNYKKAKTLNSSKTIMEEQKYDKANVNFKDISGLKSQHIKNIDHCNQNYTDLMYKLQTQKQQQPLYDKTPYKKPIRLGNYTENGDYQATHQNCSPKLDTQTQTTIVEAQTPKESETKEQPGQDELEPTNKDLLKIIAQQNEQLLVLQKQVAMLLNRDLRREPNSIESAVPPPHETNYIGEKCVTSTQNDNFKNSMEAVTGTPRKRGMSKFSIDLMTSFEVAIRPQHNKQNFVNFEPKIQEITESVSVATTVESDRNDKTVVDTSLHLQEPVNIREVCPSPEPSININMNDYDSSEDDEVTASDIGATFYQNLMGQVNNILKKAQVQTKEDLENRGERCKKNSVPSRMKEKTIDRVKEATLKHLKNIGVTIGPMDINNSSSFGNDTNAYSPTEVSFAVKQILMKYLPDDQLAKITYNQANPAPFCKEEKPPITPARPEFSFATVQYMKKYNLIPNNDIKHKDVEVPKVQHLKKFDSPKILDITALKMQPKLL